MMPHISHHLFAAAVTTQAFASRRPERAPAPPRAGRGLATAIPLELLSSADEAPARAARPLRTVASAGT